MKKVLNIVVTGIVTLSLIASLVCHANDIQKVTSFSDVLPAYWGYETIMDMTEYGIFNGTTTPVNGIGTFSPEKTMTRAEFITAALRAVYPDMAGAIEMDKDQWWRGYYVLALDKQLLKPYELDDGDFSKPMSREEMAMVMVRCVENMGEELDQRVATSQISDYNNVAEYYKVYVRDCFSFGLLCGVDSKGTFMPTKTLTRAEAATVLCRLIDEDMRVDVEFEEELTWDSYEDETDERDDRKAKDDKEDKENDREDKKDETDKVEENKKPAETEKQEEEKSDLLPWQESGAKQPEEYTWEEYEKLTEIQKQAFQYHMGYDVFDEWMYDAYFAGVNIPWENGGKQPSEYTWKEYEDLTDKQKLAFRNELGIESFDEWQGRVQPNDTTPPKIVTPPEEDQLETEEMPWDKPNAKQPEEYSYEDFEKLSAAEQIAFQNALDFDTWLERVQSESTDIEMPWDKTNAKQPEEYSYEDFEDLTPAQQMAFQNALDFEAWLERVQDNGSSDDEMPWDKPGTKRPEEYTWDDFVELTPGESIAFQSAFEEADGFEKWLTENEP